MLVCNLNIRERGSDLVCSVFCSRTLWTGWLINNRNLFFTVLEFLKYKIKTLAGSVSGEICFLLHKGLFSCCIFTGQKSK